MLFGAATRPRCGESWPPSAVYQRGYDPIAQMPAQMMSAQFPAQFPSQMPAQIHVPPPLLNTRYQEPVPPSEPQTSTNTSGNRNSRSPNWKDAETRYLLDIWAEHQPLSKRRNATAWDNIAKELNKVLAENGIASFRTGAQCKGHVKYLEEEYKKVKDHNSRSGNDNNQDSFDYFDELNDVLGCKPNIAPRHVVESGLLDKPEEPTVSVDLTTLSFPDDQSPSTSTQSQDTSKQSSPATSEVEGRDKDDDEKDALVAEAESFFFNKKKATPGKKKAKGKESTPKVPKRARRGPESPDDDDKFFMHLESSQKKDHEFFERLAEREGERELRSQKMMFDMVKEIAKIFKGD